MTAQVVSSQDEVNHVQSALYDKQQLRLQSPVPESPVPSRDGIKIFVCISLITAQVDT